MSKTIGTVIGVVLAFGVGFGLVALTLSFFVMLAWNNVMPMLFELPSLSYWQAVALFLLSELLIKSRAVTKSTK